jgi:7-cyano-7-deazaguanine synthase in queuosine biosynthesis
VGIAASYRKHLLLILLVVVSSSGFDSCDITTWANILEQEMIILKNCIFMYQQLPENKMAAEITISRHLYLIIRNGAKTISLQTTFGKLNYNGTSIKIEQKHGLINYLNIV